MKKILLAGLLFAGGLLAVNAMTKRNLSGGQLLPAGFKPNPLLPDNPQANIPYVTAEGHPGDDTNVAYIFRNGSWEVLPSAFDAAQAGPVYQGSYTGNRDIANLGASLYDLITGNRGTVAGFEWELLV